LEGQGDALERSSKTSIRARSRMFDAAEAEEVVDDDEGLLAPTGAEFDNVAASAENDDEEAAAGDRCVADFASRMALLSGDICVLAQRDPGSF